jgi:hypothetical protein
MFVRSVCCSLVLIGLLVAPGPAFADDPIKDVFDRKVPALKSGERLPLAEVEKAVLAAAARRRWVASVESPGVIGATYRQRGHVAEVTITYSDTAYSIRYRNSHRLDYNPVKQRIDDHYNEWVDALKQHIDADLERAHARAHAVAKQRARLAKQEEKAAREAARAAGSTTSEPSGAN